MTSWQVVVDIHLFHQHVLEHLWSCWNRDILRELNWLWIIYYDSYLMTHRKAIVHNYSWRCWIICSSCRTSPGLTSPGITSPRITSSRIASFRIIIVIWIWLTKIFSIDGASDFLIIWIFPFADTFFVAVTKKFSSSFSFLAIEKCSSWTS